MREQSCSACRGREGSLEKKTTRCRSWVLETFVTAGIIRFTEVTLSVAEMVGGTSKDSTSSPDAPQEESKRRDMLPSQEARKDGER